MSSKTLNVAIVSRGDASSGGAGRVAQLLAKGLREANVATRHIVRVPPHTKYRNKCELFSGIKGDILLRNAFGLDVSGLRLILSGLNKWADVVHFHDISVAYGVMAANWYAHRLPICVTLHDFSLITGGCLFPKGCTHFRTACGNCPQTGEPPLTLPIDNTRINFRRHKNLLASKRLIAVAPSAFIAKQAKLGTCRQTRIVKTDNPVNTEIFTPDRRLKGRQQLNLTDEMKALLFVATRLDDDRKGLGKFLEIFRELSRRRPGMVLILVGKFSDRTGKFAKLDERVRYLGPICEEDKLADIYAAVDCCVIPSQDDNVPCTAAESISCGTPILARHTGGLAEMFEDNGQGKLLSSDSIVEWDQAINDLLESCQAEKRALIRQYALERYQLQSVVKSHINLYEKMLAVA